MPDAYPWGEITTAELFREHDRLMRDNNWKVATGLTFSWRHIDLFASLQEFVGGTDTHAGRAFTTGLVMHFERSRAPTPEAPAQGDKERFQGIAFGQRWRGDQADGD